MSRSFLFFVLMFGCVVSYAQNISVTFTGTGAATRIDSVTATNLATGQSVTFTGDGTLILNINTGIPWVSELTNQGMVFPNPFSGKTTFTATVRQPQTVYLKVQNLVGQVITQTNAFVEAGECEFSISLNQAGIYMVTLTTGQGTASYKVICTEATEADNRIRYLGPASNNHNNHNNPNNLNNLNNLNSPSLLKSSQTTYTLGYTEGETILYRCMSDVYTTLLTDSPTFSKNYEVEFAGCTDRERKNYAIVKIGYQTWMAENLAWLPFVNDGGIGPDSKYYVFGYSGNSISEAKATSNYINYGVLYQWEEAAKACPAGWHLPGDDELTLLIEYLTSNGYGFEGSGSDIAKSLAAPSGWASSSKAGTVGNDQTHNNSSDFMALPGGSWFGNGGFFNLGCGGFFWSSKEDGNSDAWYRSIGSGEDGIYQDSRDKYSGFSVRCIRNQ